jgi:hypothetical protein
MNLPRTKKYLALSLVLTVLLVARTTGAQIMPAPENLSSTSVPLVTDEPIILVESSSTPNTIAPVIPKARTSASREQRTALTQVRQTRITNLAANISNRMDAAVIRLQTISLRLEQRIIKMEGAGTETSLAKEKLALANELLINARLKLGDIDTLVNEATYSTEPQNNWQTVRERYQETSSLIRQAHLTLQESITTLKNPVLRTQNTASTSTEINTAGDELISN